MGDDGGTPDGAVRDVETLDASDRIDASPDAEVPFACPDATSVDSAEAFLDHVPSAFNSSWRIGSERITTPPLRASADIVVSFGDIPIPTDCGSACANEMNVWTDVPGVAVDYLAEEIQVSEGTEFRMRFHSEMWVPRWARVPGLGLLPSCRVRCEENQTRCPVDGVCYHNGPESCVHCAGDPLARCVCVEQWTPLREQPDGSECHVCPPEDDICNMGMCSDRWCAGPF